MFSELTCTVSNCLQSGIGPQGVKIIFYFICRETETEKKEKRGSGEERREGEYLDVPWKLTNADNEAFKMMVWGKQ